MDIAPLLDQFFVLLKVVLAMLLAGLVGFEREVKDRPAGLRTHMLVGGAAALFVGLANFLTNHMLNTVGNNAVSADPVRIIQAIVTGISFLGAGTILKNRKANDPDEKIQGLTTAASLLFVAGIGMTIAADEYVLGVGGALLGLLVLRGINILERKIGTKDEDD